MASSLTPKGAASIRSPPDGASGLHGATDLDWLGLYLVEDLGSGDVTSDALLDARHESKCRVVAREATLAAGLGHAVELFRRLGVVAVPKVRDGEAVPRGAVVLAVEGPTRAVLAGERVVLNLLARMMGIAAATRRAQQAYVGAGGRGQVAATRKTTPGFRRFEKEAVAIGGGHPHRAGLWDAAMVKDNHRDALAGSVGNRRVGGVAGMAEVAVATLRRTRPGLEVCCEVESLEDALAAAGAGAHWILIDNQSPATGQAWAREVRVQHPSVRIEASGGIRPDRVGDYAWADRVSLGCLTRESPPADLSLEWYAAPGGEA